jgi:hypothetical protein
MFVTAPAIGRLVARPRLWAFEQVKRGRFGAPVRRHARRLEVELANVEAALGIGFSPEQLAAAGITIHSEHEEAA